MWAILCAFWLVLWAPLYAVRYALVQRKRAKGQKEKREEEEGQAVVAQRKRRRGRKERSRMTEGEEEKRGSYKMGWGEERESGIASEIVSEEEREGRIAFDIVSEEKREEEAGEEEKREEEEEWAKEKREEIAEQQKREGEEVRRSRRGDEKKEGEEVRRCPLDCFCVKREMSSPLEEGRSPFDRLPGGRSCSWGHSGQGRLSTEGGDSEDGLETVDLSGYYMHDFHDPISVMDDLATRSAGCLRVFITDCIYPYPLHFFIERGGQTLQHLSLGNSFISDAWAYANAPKLPSLRILDISGCNDLEWGGILDFGLNCKSLTHLTVAPRLNEDCRAIAYSMKQLKYLQVVEHAGVPFGGDLRLPKEPLDEGLLHILECCTKLEVMAFSGKGYFFEIKLCDERARACLSKALHERKFSKQWCLPSRV